jgi:heme exporter protein A
MIATHSLAKFFGLRPVLRKVEFTVARGECVALLGPNGTGKTTLLRVLATLSKPTSGQVTVAGFDLPRGAEAVRRRLGVVSHNTLLYPDLTAEENLQFYARMYGLAQPAERIGQVLAQVGLAPRRRDFVRTFSRGMQQRLAIARAILHDPELILFDEPYTGLDPAAATMLDGVLRHMAAEGRTVFWTTHDLPRALTLASRVLILARGAIAYEAPCRDLALLDFMKTYETVVAQ